MMASPRMGGRRPPTCLVLVILLWARSVGLDAQSHREIQPPTEQPSQPDPAQQSAQQTALSGLFVRAFGAVNWGATNKRDVPTSFALGQFALFATSALSERVSVLAEVVMEASRNTRVVTDLERLQLTFRFDDHLHVSAGRYSTGIGFYNTAFHHGSYFETPIGRPRVFAFEDEGGVMSVHEVGISAGGAVPGTGSTLDYLAEIGNGRSFDSSSDDISAAADTNGAKSTNVGASFRPRRWQGIQIGTSYYRDEIARQGLPSVPNRIATAFVVYKTPSTEIIAEWLRLSHQTDGVTFINHAGYLQASRAWGILRPYYRYDRLTIDPGTPFIGPLGSYSANIIGLRVDPGEKVGLKAQFERSNEAGQRGVHSLRTQLVFVF
jgi:hypothetical protein